MPKRKLFIACLGDLIANLYEDAYEVYHNDKVASKLTTLAVRRKLRHQASLKSKAHLS